MNKKAKIVLSEKVKDGFLCKMLEKLLTDFDDFLFGKTEMRCLISACIAGNDGELFASFSTNESCPQINEDVLYYAEMAQKNWLDDPKLEKVDMNYEYGLCSLVMGNGESIINLGIGFCVDSPYGQEALDVLKSVALRTHYDYYWWEQLERIKSQWPRNL